MQALHYTPQGIEAENRAVVENVEDEFGATPPDTRDDDIVGLTILPNIAVSKQLDSPGPVHEGEEVTFTIQITNVGATDIVELPLDDLYDPA